MCSHKIHGTGTFTYICFEFTVNFIHGSVKGFDGFKTTLGVLSLERLPWFAMKPPEEWPILLTKTWMCLSWSFTFYHSTMGFITSWNYMFIYFFEASKKSKFKKRHWLLKHNLLFPPNSSHVTSPWMRDFRRGFPHICVPFAPYRMAAPPAICPEEPRIVTGTVWWTRPRGATCWWGS